MEQQQQPIQRGDWVTVGNFSTPVGFVKRVARDRSWADVDWHTHTKRMPTRSLHIQTTIKIGECEVTDLTRQRELEEQQQPQQ
jgi:hypothetical protein